MKGIGIISKTSQKVDFEWKIIDFFCYTEEKVRLWSPKFHVLNSAWKISIYPNGNTNDNIEHVGVYLHNIGGEIPASVDFIFGIKTADDIVEYKRTLDWKSAATSWGWSEFIKRSIIEEEKYDLVPSGNLTLHVSFIVNYDEQDVDVDAGLNRLVENLTELCISKKNSDVSLKINSETIWVHKDILSARSPIFSAMFENNMSEKETGVVNISDCNLEAFNVFLMYLYSGKVKFKECDVFDLYKISDKYDVPELKLLCIDYMIRNLSVKNVCETFVFSHEFEEERLKSFTQQFFCFEFQKIISSDAWKSLLEEHCNLANDLLLGMAPKVSIVW